MYVSTHDYHLMLGKNMISQLEMTEKSCYYPPPHTPLNRLGPWRSRTNSAASSPPPLNRVGSWRSRKNPATTPPPLNRVGFWRSRKRLTKFNNLNLAALNVDECYQFNRLLFVRKSFHPVAHEEYDGRSCSGIITVPLIGCSQRNRLDSRGRACPVTAVFFGQIATHTEIGFFPEGPLPATTRLLVMGCSTSQTLFQVIR